MTTTMIMRYVALCFALVILGSPDGGGHRGATFALLAWFVIFAVADLHAIAERLKDRK